MKLQTPLRLQNLAAAATTTIKRRRSASGTAENGDVTASLHVETASSATEPASATEPTANVAKVLSAAGVVDDRYADQKKRSITKVPSENGNRSSHQQEEETSNKSQNVTSKGTPPQQQQQRSLASFKQNLQRGLAAAKAAGHRRLDHAQKRLQKSRTVNTKQEPAIGSKDVPGAAKDVPGTLSVSEGDWKAEKEVVDGTRVDAANEKCRSLVVATPSSVIPNRRNTEISISAALAEWCACVHDVWKSREMEALRQQTCNVTATARHSAVETALLPVHLAGNAGSHLTQGIAALPSLALGLLGQATHQVAGDLLSLVLPMNGTQHRDYFVRSQKERDKLVERLSLTTGLMQDEELAAARHFRESKLLLRVSDLLLQEQTSSSGLDETGTLKKIPRTMLYVDLSPVEDSIQSRLQRVLDRLVSVGLGLLCSHPMVSMAQNNKTVTTKKSLIEWKCQGGTASLLKSLTKQPSPKDRLQLLQEQALLWSGNFLCESDWHQRQFPLYLARGILPLSPLQLLQLLWDNTRTAEYNSFCNSRTTVLNLNEAVSKDDKEANTIDSSGSGTKVIRSETKVPFTSFTVQMTCLMHCRPLEDDKNGYVIVSRSLSRGPAGTSFQGDSDSGRRERFASLSPSEILWGVNVIRSVAGHPHLAELTNLSQVGYTGVRMPQFLASKIAVRGVQEFFENVRRHNTGCQSTLSKEPTKPPIVAQAHRMLPQSTLQQ